MKKFYLKNHWEFFQIRSFSILFVGENKKRGAHPGENSGLEKFLSVSFRLIPKYVSELFPADENSF